MKSNWLAWAITLFLGGMSWLANFANDIKAFDVYLVGALVLVALLSCMEKK